VASQDAPLMVCLLYLVSTIFAMSSSAEGGLPAVCTVWRFLSIHLTSTPYQNAAIPVRKASHRTDTCNVVIFGETGAGKSSLVNLITRDQKSVEISPDATGRTAVTTVHDADIPIGNNSLGVRLFDTSGQCSLSLSVGDAAELDRRSW
jgi:putative ribosome biogenesis GTPase RsgA